MPGIQADVFGRAKKPHSIWRKMEEKKIGFSRLSDIYGFRIIVESDEDCYATLGAVHRRWRAVPGRFKDYISQPKSNGYRSLHTTVSGRDGKRVEIQIRTREMHEVAEAGVAAHWSYRDGVQAENPFAVDPAKWIANISERFDNADDHDEFLEHVKTGDVRRPGIRLHAQGRCGEIAARRDTAGFRLSDPHPYR